MLRTITLLAISLVFVVPQSAQAKADSTFQRLYQQYYRLRDTDDKEAFYDASRQLQQYSLDKGDMTYYYRLRQEKIYFDANHAVEPNKMIMEANELLEEMEKNGDGQFGIVYRALGIIFESRGNYRMAVHYYQESLDNIAPTDSIGLAYTYALMASVSVTRYPDKAHEWCDRLRSVVTPEMPQYQLYLMLKGIIYFYERDKTEFLSLKREYDEYIKTHTVYERHPRTVLDAMEKAFTGRYSEALRLLDQTEEEGYDAIKLCNIRIRVYEMMGQHGLALKETDKRRNLRDSLYNDLIFNNLNEVNAKAGIIRLNEQAAREAKARELWMTIAIVLLVVALILMASRYFLRRRYQRKILKQNELLEVALDEAKEGERIKNSFINHITHEIRTPLNILTGYVHIIADSGYELSKEERDVLLEGIDQNTVAITNIVNDLLEVSQSESKERYRRDELVAVNDFCRRIMMGKEAKNKGRLALEFQTALPDDFLINSNQRGLDRILKQLLNNALKFTKQGRVELFVDKDVDNDMVRFVVTDTGIGIPEEHHEQVFENFYKVDTYKPGMGIGLSMSRRIALLLGGNLVIDKTYHDGTRMVLTIPINMKDDK